jgi:hypothetical protein
MLGVTDLMELLTMHRVRFGRRLDPGPGTTSDIWDDN